MPNTPLPGDVQITKNNVLASFTESISELFGELKAWRKFGADVTSFLRERGLADEFAAYQERQTVKTIKAAAQKQRAKRTSRAPI